VVLVAVAEASAVVELTLVELELLIKVTQVVQMQHHFHTQQAVVAERVQLELMHLVLILVQVVTEFHHRSLVAQ
jgi:hypothetical protein